jgi:phosphoribosylformylglycinamidine (FGAM) synthase-like enzyme
LAVTLAECCFAAKNLSAQVNLTGAEPDEVTLFGERGARAVVSVTPGNLARVRPLAAPYGVAAREIGRVTRSEFRIQLNGWVVVSVGVFSLADIWTRTLEELVCGSSKRRNDGQGVK